MDNTKIICGEAVASGYFTTEEVAQLIENGQEIPFHSYSYWKSKGMRPRRNEKGWECQLWRHSLPVEEGESESEEDKKGKFYKVNTKLFHLSQVEKIKS